MEILICSHSICRNKFSDISFIGMCHNIMLNKLTICIRATCNFIEFQLRVTFLNLNWDWKFIVKWASGVEFDLQLRHTVAPGNPIPLVLGHRSFHLFEGYVFFLSHFRSQMDRLIQVTPAEYGHLETIPMKCWPFKCQFCINTGHVFGHHCACWWPSTYRC